ncbi:RGS1-HXK1-interacting protein 1-like [Primulina tabacum]|uniref:RGS1-HXK1-interacting protein 1-like n=1 Tax=Primulina tabacum TaxID=48773 RepID=UPI003F5A7A1A
MATIAGESSEGKPDGIPPAVTSHKVSEFIEENIPWMDYAVQQAQIAQKTVERSVEDAIDVTKSRFDRIITTSSAHFNQTIDSLQSVKSDCSAYEDIVFGKMKEGFLIASSHPLMATGVGIGLGLLGLKRTRQFLYYNSLRLFVNEEVLLSRADVKVKELRQSMDLLKVEAEKLERKAMQAEDDLLRGRTKLRQAGKQIHTAINSAYKIERQAGGLKDVLRELPSREASRFRTQVMNLAKEAKRERNSLFKEVTKISNYGISV